MYRELRQKQIFANVSASQLCKNIVTQLTSRVVEITKVEFEDTFFHVPGRHYYGQCCDIYSQHRAILSPEADSTYNLYRHTSQNVKRKHHSYFNHFKNVISTELSQLIIRKTQFVGVCAFVLRLLKCSPLHQPTRHTDTRP